MIGRFETFTLSFLSILSDWNKIASDELKVYDLKGSYIVYLIALYKNTDGLTAKNLCDICGKDKAEVSRAIAIMEKKKLYPELIRQLTDKGREITKNLRERVKLAVNKGGEGLTEEQREQFYFALEKISINLRNISKEGL